MRVKAARPQKPDVSAIHTGAAEVPPIVKARISRAVNPLRREIERLKAKNAAMYLAGAQMANAMFNMSQWHDPTSDKWDELIPTLKQCYKRWDKVISASGPSTPPPGKEKRSASRAAAKKGTK